MTKADDKQGFPCFRGVNPLFQGIDKILTWISGVPSWERAAIRAGVQRKREFLGKQTAANRIAKKAFFSILLMIVAILGGAILSRLVGDYAMFVAVPAIFALIYRFFILLQKYDVMVWELRCQ